MAVYLSHKQIPGKRPQELYDYRPLKKLERALRWCLNEAHEGRSDYSTWPKQDLLNIEEKAKKISDQMQTKASKRIYGRIALLIKSILNPTFLPNDLLPEIASRLFDTRDLNALSRVSRQTSEFAARSTIVHARRWGYLGESNEQSKLFLKELFTQTRSLSTLCTDILLFRDGPKKMNQQKRKYLYGEVILKNFQNAPIYAKVKLLTNTKFYAPEYAVIRRIIQPDSQPPTAKFSSKKIDPTMHVVRSGEKNLIEFLIQSIDYTDMRSHPLHFAAQFGLLATIKEILVIDPLAINKPGIHGATPLCFACGFISKINSNIRLAVVEYLLNAGANPNISTDLNMSGNGQYPLHFAIIDGHLEIVELLLIHQADQAVPDVLGITPKMLANNLQRQDMIHLLETYQ